ncbi:type 1 glutamine amidotransferase [Williamsia sterculiae]|uniref:GMP synthase-Glutamine amidotransferase n=1 Tax=Williamsia sterculiae TaxID=1344003 RepID=A0A1N7GP13_9NOCA|nr:type 1 glutamine amidotransferase [Williamsia sterculiae]SIS14286.1 GMP synthase-Glutamine amidotransferase [Williamsia sterculiae]
MSTVLFLAHEDDRDRGRANAGSLADHVAASGHEVVIAHPSDDLPDVGSLHSVIVLGSALAAYDESVSWSGAEVAYLRSALAADTPILGICFGGQQLSRVLGGTVGPAPAPEVGFVTVRSDRADLVDSGPWMQMHWDRFTTPPGATTVARNPAAAQAFVHGPHLGVQFHPEISPAVFDSWTADWSDAKAASLESDLGVDIAALRRQIVDTADENAARCGRLFDAFVGLREHV